MISEKNKLESDYMATSAQLRITEVTVLLLFLFWDFSLKTVCTCVYIYHSLQCAVLGMLFNLDFMHFAD